MSFAVVGGSLIGLAGTAAVAALTNKNVDQPDMTESSRKTVLADLRTLPGRRMLEAAARKGTAVDYPTGRQIPIYGSKGAFGQRKIIGYQPELKHADFTGKGDADVAGELGRQMANLSLGTQQKYGVEFATEARKQAELADPLGFAARKTLGEQLMQRDAHPQPVNPMAGVVDAQILADLQQGRGLSGDAAAAIAEMAARRGGAAAGVTGDFQAGLEQGPEAEARNLRAQQHALSFLSSGATPEDVEYRRKQQSLADMGKFLSGRTPEAQFASLSGAQQGATPRARAPGLPGPDASAGTTGQQGALLNYSQQVKQVTGNVNDWFSGLSSLVKLGGAGVAASKSA